MGEGFLEVLNYTYVFHSEIIANFVDQLESIVVKRSKRRDENNPLEFENTVRETLAMADKAFRLQAMSFRERETDKGATSRIAEFFASNKFLTTVFILCLATLATVYRPDSNGINLEGYTNGLEFQIRSRALRRASWDTFVDTSRPSRRRNPFSRPRRAFVSSLHTADYFPLSLAMGYSLSQTNDIAAQNAEMVLFVRKAAIFQHQHLINFKK